MTEKVTVPAEPAIRVKEYDLRLFNGTSILVEERVGRMDLVLMIASNSEPIVNRRLLFGTESNPRVIAFITISLSLTIFLTTLNERILQVLADFEDGCKLGWTLGNEVGSAEC